MSLISWLELLGFIAVPLGGGMVVASLTPSADSTWYHQLNKPTWTPPGWAFPVVWTTLYVLMGVASWLVWQRGGLDAQWLPLAVYLVQLVLNFAWTPLFFGQRRIDLALVDIILLWVAIAATIGLFFHVDRMASYLLLPYIVWVSIAFALNYYIFKHNPSSPSAPLIGNQGRSAY